MGQMMMDRRMMTMTMLLFFVGVTIPTTAT
jgi:hypothetical protein